MATITNAQIYAGLQFGGLSWAGSPVTFSLPGATAVWSAAAYGAGSEPTNSDYGVLNANQQSQFVNAIGAWERLVDLDLVQVTETGSSVGQIRVAFTDVDDQGRIGSAAYAYSPPPKVNGLEAPKNGDIWIDDAYKAADASAGGFLYETFLHELGHALGLKHSFEGAAVIPAEFDSTRYTVMSYTRFEDQLRFFEQSGNTLFGKAGTVSVSTPMPLDIIAIQGLYGASTSEALGADTYTFDQNRGYMMTIVDNGGVDTFNLAAQTRGSIINLTPGAFSSIGLYSKAAQIDFWLGQFPTFGRAFITSWIDRPDTYTWSDNVATSQGTVIENVLAGSGADTITGNAANNMISAGAGGDMVLAGLGNDTIIGGAGGNSYLRGEEGNDTISGGEGFDDINGNQGNDTAAGGAGDDFVVGGKDNDVLFGEDGIDYVYGNLGDDSCDGGAGNDIVRGGQGNDTLAGGAGADFMSGDLGDDTMTGGAGADLFHSFWTAGVDRVLDFNAAEGDRVFLDAGTTYSAVQAGTDVMISMQGGMVILVGVSLSSLLPTSIFLG